MMNTSVIDRFLDTFTRYIDSGFGLVSGEVAFLATTLVALDMALAALLWAWGADGDILARLVRKTLYTGFFAFLIGNFNSLAKIVFESFSGLGLKAAGSSLTADQLLQPGRLAQIGIDAGRPILQTANGLTGYTTFFTNAIEIAVLMAAWLVVLVSFFVLAIRVFITLIEFKLTTLAGFVLVPFGLFGKTAFLAERVLGNVIASGVKILVLAVIVGIGTGLFGEFTQGFGATAPALDDVLAMALGALALLGLGIFGPGIATGLGAGSPQLGAGAAVVTASAVTAAAVAGAGAVRAGTAVIAATARRASGTADRPPFAADPRGGAAAGYGADSASEPAHEPAWARRRRHAVTEGLAAMGRGLGAMGRALRSGDRAGAGTAVNLREER